MAINKKGIFFTFASIALSIIILFSFNAYTDYGSKDKMQTTEIRINTMNNFLKDLENDLENVIFIISFRSLLSLEDYMMENNDFLINLETSFDEVFTQGTINSEKMSLMEGNNFLNWTDRMKTQANKTNIILDFTIDSVTISHSSPWMVDVSVDLTINVHDKKNTVSWTINNEFTRKINITGFVDPLYLVNNNGKVNNTIRKTPVNPASSASSLGTHLINSYYIEHSDAPSYLDRFENDLTGSSYGIESLVNSQKLIDAGLSAKDRSAVDYIYYGIGITTNCDIDGLEVYDWFKLDSGHLGFYEAECEH